MKFSLLVSLFVVLASILSLTEFARAASKEYVEGEILVKFKNGIASPESFSANASAGASVVEEFPELGLQVLKLPANITTEEGLKEYANFAGVEYVQPNFIYHIALTPNDTRFSELYGMQKISAPAAWDVTTGSSNIVVAIIDTGVRYTHEDLAANMWQNPGEIAGNGIDDDGNGYIDDVVGYDFINNDSDPNDDFNHGTHVAGTIGGVGNNGKGVAGVNWNVRLMALKIHDSAGNSTSAKIVQAYQYVRMMRLQRGINIRVTNNSYGGCPEACAYDQATKDAIDAAGDANILNVFAAGNNSSNNETTPFFPSSYDSPSILAVAASDSSDNRSGFSNYGLNRVDLAAPGSAILSTVNGSNTSYGSLSGTSMASPHAAGAAALLAASNPSLSAASLKASLMNSVDVLPQWNGVVKTGGRLNIARAIQQPTVCAFTVPNQFPPIPAQGGSVNINVTAPVNCDFSAISLNSWLTISSGNPGSGNTIVTVSAPSNNGAPRGGTIRIAGQNVGIAQAGVNPPLPLTRRAILDFDGDNRTDFSVLQNSNGSAIWHNFSSGNGYQAVNFGLFTDASVPADFDGDGKTDVAVWREGAQSYFYVLNSSDNTFQAVQWGITGDNPRIVQDFDGDNRTDFAVTRIVNNQLFWYIRQSSNNQFRGVQFGVSSDLPVRGDFDGDNQADIAVYRPAAGNPANTFFVLKSSDAGLLARNFGVSTTDRIVSGDFDGDGKSDFAVWRTTNGFWYWVNSSTGAFSALQFGQTSDLPVPGDYDGDGKTDVAVWRANATASESAVFYINRSTAGFTAFGWGQNGMRVPANSLQVSN